MLSLQSRLFVFGARNKILRRVVGGDETDWGGPAPEVRRQTEAVFKGLKPPKGVVVTPAAADGVRGEWVSCASSDSDRVLLFFHGGGYMICSPQTHRSLVGHIVVSSGIQAFSLDYRLAPEHPFPAALDDAVASYRWLLDQGFLPRRIVVAGDSAGGGLTLATLVALRDRGIPLPAAAIALSPWTDLACTGRSIRANAPIDPLISQESCAIFARHYAGMRDPSQPLISPLYADLRSLPPLLIHVGTLEILRDDSERFVAKARVAGVDVTYKVWDGMWHVFQATVPFVPEANRAVREIGAFVKRHLG